MHRGKPWPMQKVLTGHMKSSSPTSAAGSVQCPAAWPRASSCGCPPVRNDGSCRAQTLQQTKPWHTFIPWPCLQLFAIRPLDFLDRSDPQVLDIPIFPTADRRDSQASWPRTKRQPFPDPESPDVPILLSNVLAKGEVLEFGMWLGVGCDSWWDSARMAATCPLPMSPKAHGIMANAHPIPHILRASCTAQRQLCNSRERSSKVSQDGTAVGFAGGVPILAIHLAAMQSRQYQTGSQKVGSWITCHCQNSCGPWVFKDRKHGHPLRTLSLEVLPALVYKCMYVCMNEWMYECMNVWMYECMNVGM